MSRPNRPALVAGGLAATLLLIYLAAWLGVTRLEVGRADFTSTYMGATLLREGHGDRLYDESLQQPLHSQLIAPGDHQGNLPFVNPPGAALLALPASLLDLPVAYRVWSLLQLVLLALGVAAAVRAAPWPRSTPRAVPVAAWLLGVAGAGTVNTLLLGQWDGLLTLGVGMAYAAWRRGNAGVSAALQRRNAGVGEAPHRARQRPDGGGTAAGAWLAAVALLAKPHLFFGVAAFLVFRRDRRALLGAGAAAVVVGGLSLALVGPHGMADFARLSLGGTDRWPLSGLLGFTGLFGSWLGNAPSAHALAAVCSVVALGACGVLGARSREQGKLETALAGTLALSLVASPHLLGHDLALLAPAAAWMLAAPTMAAKRALVAWVLINCAAALDFGNSQPAPPGRIVPIALAVAGAVALRATTRREPVYSGSGSGVGGVVDQS